MNKKSIEDKIISEFWIKLNKKNSLNIIFSMAFVNILDFIPSKDIFKLQLLCKFVYNEIMPKYCLNWQIRSSTFSKLIIPERKSKAAILLF